MSSTSSIHSIFSDDELPAYEEIALPPNVTIEEREIFDEDDISDEDDEHPEHKSTIKQSTKTFASLKSFLSGSVVVAPSAEFQKSTLTFTALPTRPKSDRKPSFKRESNGNETSRIFTDSSTLVAPIQTSTLQSRRMALRSTLQLDNAV